MKIAVSMKKLLLLSALFVLPGFAAGDAGTCEGTGLWLQVLGSGGPEVQTRRASSSYLIWQEGRARILIDAGGGSSLRFGESGAQVSDLSAIVFTHLHADHSADFAALVKSSFFEGRREPLPVLGPEGNELVPSVVEFVHGLFSEPKGIYRYLSDFLDDTATVAYRLRPGVVTSGEHISLGPDDAPAVLTAISVHHGPIPALAWAVQIDGRKLVFSGDMNGSTGNLNKLARDADLLVAHNAVPEDVTGVARNLHMPPSVIGEIAAAAGVRRLVLSHRMQRTLGRESETVGRIREHYQGPLDFADDLDCFSPRAKQPT